MLTGVAHRGRWELAMCFGRWSLLWDGFGVRVGCCWRIGPEHQDMVFGVVRILVLLLVFSGTNV